MAGVALEDIDVLELYDCYTYTVLVTLEDYGFCDKGEGGAFVEDGKLGPGGSLPTNTGGGQLSSFYMWGFTPLSEGVIQAAARAASARCPSTTSLSSAATAARSTGTRRRCWGGGVTSGIGLAKPLPIVDAASRPFFEAAREGVLVLRRCRSCATFMSPIGGIGTPLRPRCVRCFSGDLEWAPATGKATLYSFALMHQLYDPSFADVLPYNISVAELDEGVRLTTNVVDCANEEL